jgi:hypothetical protein
MNSGSIVGNGDGGETDDCSWSSLCSSGGGVLTAVGTMLDASDGGTGLSCRMFSPGR